MRLTPVPSKRDLTRQAMKSFVVNVPLSSDEVATRLKVADTPFSIGHPTVFCTQREGDALLC